MAYPNFLGIGSQKAGTSWLHANLRQHPEISTPPLKELHYFDIPQQSPIILHLGQNSASGRRARLALPLLRRHPQWTLRYLCRFRNDQWYASLFSPAAGQICGESTPDYAPLAPHMIARVHALMPEARLIYLLRDPVERIWSQAKMWTQKRLHRHIDSLAEAELHDLINQNWHKFYARSDYLSTLANWQSYYAPERIWIGFFEQVTTAPASVLKSVLSFLDVASDDRVVPPDVAMARNVRPGKPIPIAMQRILYTKTMPHFEALHDHFNNEYTAAWLQRAKKVHG